MSSRSPKDVPPSSPAEGPSSADGLYTSEDLFGDLIDAPLEPKAVPPRTAAAPIRVQVNDGNDAGQPKTAEIAPNEVSSLVEAFGGGLPAAADTPATPKPAARVHESPLAAADEEDLSGLLNAIGGDDVTESVPPPAPVAPEPAAAPLLPAAPGAPVPAAPAGHAATPTDLDSLLDGALSPAEMLDSRTRAHAPEPLVQELEAAPESRLATRFAAADPKVEVSGSSRMLIDLAGLAEDALAAPAPTERAGTRSGVGDVYGPYTLLERIAAGGMAEVFKAKRSGVEGFEKVVAVKRILPHLSDNKEFVDMFIDEAKVVAGLTHPNIVHIFDLGRLDDAYFIAMEYVHGRDLRSILRRAKDKGLRLPFDLAGFVVSRVCSALEHAHTRKDDQGRPLRLVHRDISPQNILISFEGDVKLTDFGIAKATSKASSTDRGALRGKLLYMSPEQASGQPIDRRSDVFSLGVVLYEMLTDRKPFMGTSEKGILEMVRECQIDPPTRWNDRVPPELERITLKALARHPDERYQEAGDMHRDLERALVELGPPSPRELARLLEVLFEREERGIKDAPEEAQPSFEMDFEEKQEPARADEVARLLKKHGIGR